MDKPSVWYLSQRAEQLAILYLSRRDDLAIHSYGRDYGPDLMVEIYRENRITGRVFGVEVKGTTSVKHEDEDTVKYRLSIRHLEFLMEVPFPVIVLVFDMRDDQGYFNWINSEPLRDVVNAESKYIETFIFEKVTDERLARLISDINRWYDERATGEERFSPNETV